MSKGIYNFTDEYGKNIKDKSPDWMDDLFKNGIKKKDPVIINDIFNTNKQKCRKCSICGSILNDNEIGKCKNCIKLKKNS